MLNGRQFQQLQMFMSPREIQEQYQPGDGDRYGRMEGKPEETADDLYARKLSAAQEKAPYSASSLYDSVAVEGVKSPVHLGEEQGLLGKPQVVGGHHRIAAQAEIDEDKLMPVLHHRDVSAAKSIGGRGYWYT